MTDLKKIEEILSEINELKERKKNLKKVKQNNAEYGSIRIGSAVDLGKLLTTNEEVIRLEIEFAIDNEINYVNDRIEELSQKILLKEKSKSPDMAVKEDT